MLAERPRNGEIRVTRARLRPVTLAALPSRLLVPVPDRAHDGDLHPGPRQGDQGRTKRRVCAFALGASFRIMKLDP